MIHGCFLNPKLEVAVRMTSVVKVSSHASDSLFHIRQKSISLKNHKDTTKIKFELVKQVREVCKNKKVKKSGPGTTLPLTHPPTVNQKGGSGGHFPFFKH